MKKLLKISAIAVIGLALTSCSQEDDLLNPQSNPLSAKNTGAEERISFIKTEVIAESGRASNLSAGQSLVLNAGNAHVHLDVQYDGNLVLYANPIQWFGPSPNPVKWASNTSTNNSVQPFLVAQTDGNLVLYKNGPYIAANSVWATNTTAGSVSDPKFKIQVIKKTNSLNSSSPKYYATFILEGNNSERHEITVSEITNIY